MKHVWHRYFTASISCELLRWVLTGSPRNFGNFLPLCFERNKCLCRESWAGLGWAVNTGLSQPRSRRRAWKSALSGLSVTSGFETLAQGLHYGSGKIGSALEPTNLWALLLTSSNPWVPRVAPQGAGLQLGSLGISTPARNKLNWMFEAFLTWHQGAPSGLICLLGKQRIWPHAAVSH